MRFSFKQILEIETCRKLSRKQLVCI